MSSNKRKRHKKRVMRVSVRAERRTEPDWDKFAYALLQYTRLVMDAEAKQREGKRKGSA